MAGERHDLVALAGRGHDLDLGEALGQQLAPAVGREQRMVGATGGVLEPPPAVGEAEDEVAPGPPSCRLQQHEHAAGRQQPPGMLDRYGQIAGRVQHVAGDDQIIAGGREPLLGRVLLDVELGEGGGIRPEPLRRLGQERRREIGEGVAPALGRHALAQGLEQGTGAGADLQDAGGPGGSAAPSTGSTAASTMPLSSRANAASP